jgi:hypothetical protein
MSSTSRPTSDVAFTERVKAVQSRLGSRAAYARLERRGGFETEIGEELSAFIAEQRSVFLATASAEGQPYVQHRGGPPGFLKVLDPRTLAFADFAGNRQFISLGNLAENPRVHLFLMDYARRQRVKIWGEARVVEDDRSLLARLTPEGYKARPERAIVICVTAWDANCPQHIPQRFEADDVKVELAERDARNAVRQGAAMSDVIHPRPPLPPFTRETALQKVRAAEDAWNGRAPERVSLAYTPDSRWRNRSEFIRGRPEIVAFLTRKWARELDYRLIKELWAFNGNRIAVRFAYEWHDDSGSWFRSNGNENWEFDESGLMQARHASINDLPILESDRLFRWPQGRRPDDYPGLSDLGL